jgi:hypothetical protein
MKLDRNGGIAIHFAAERPRGVATENWLPISRGDVPLNYSCVSTYRICRG